MNKIKTVGVIGAGTMGSALAQKFAQDNFNVILVDVNTQFIQKGIERIKSSLNEAIEKKIFSAVRVSQILSRINETVDLNELQNCEIIIEAVFEDFKIKSELLKSISKLVSKETIIATNTSSFSVNELSKVVDYPERFIGLHFFYHAAKNRLVEIIPSVHTSKEVIAAVKFFSILAGKDAIFTKDKNGFAVNRFFVPWLNEAVRIYEEGLSDIDEIDNVCLKLFGIGMGPFALMNATGVKIAYHAQKTLETFGNFYLTSELLKEQAESGIDWNINLKEISISAEKEKLISERMLGVVFLVSSQIIEEEVCSSVELNRGARIGLKWKNGPVDLMLKYGVDEVQRLIELFTKKYSIQVPKSINENFWNLEFVTLNKINSNAVITINRPEDLNALNENVIHQLETKFDEADNSPNIENIFITGSGKAFIAGADIKFFIKNIKKETLDNIVSFTKYGQDVLSKIENSKKNVVAVLNGLTLGGGLELALTADIILAVESASLSFPETGIGIYPGLGGTQRCPAKIGNGLAKYLIFTGKNISANDAFEIGLVDKVINHYEMYELLNGLKSILDFKIEKNELSHNYQLIKNFFETNSIDTIFDGEVESYELSYESVTKLIKMIKWKAPIALKTAEELIDKAEGVESELKKLKMIFSTNDAMIGLSSIGKKVEFEGR